LEAGASPERGFLENILEKGVTYIADRGYGSFEIIANVLKAEANLIFRVRDNLLFEVREVLEITASEMPKCFRNVTDELIIFKNDKHRNEVRPGPIRGVSEQVSADYQSV